MSDVIVGPAFTPKADTDELRYREEVEPYPDVEEDLRRHLEREWLVDRLEHALDEARLRPAGTVVELGAGSCWLSAVLARRPEVARVIAVDFSRRRLEQLAPVTFRLLGAPTRKLSRLLADFHNPGIDPGTADYVFTDASLHHAADPDTVVREAYETLVPAGRLVLFREPTRARLRGSRDRGVEAQHGDFEHDYYAGEYLAFLSRAGFRPERFTASGGRTLRRQRLALHPPLRWLNGWLFAEFTYVGTKPSGP